MQTPIRVLLVEDDPDTSRLFARRLAWSRAAQFDVVLADDLQTALREIESGPLDVVLLDLGLPDGDPMSTLAMAGAIARHVPIVVLTAQDDDDLAVMAARLGCQDYLVKPQDVAHLSRSVLMAIERHQWIRPPSSHPGDGRADLTGSRQAWPAQPGGAS